jgi:uncharacterized glyoxalase superfamily protein PhnB
VQNIAMHSVTPVLRIFDVDRAKAFYLNFLEFQLDWEDRSEGSPAYMQISFAGNCPIHLSEHHGDGCPGANLRIEINDAAEYQRRLIGKAYKYFRPGLEKAPWGDWEVSVTDPFGNRLTFFQRSS